MTRPSSIPPPLPSAPEEPRAKALPRKLLIASPAPTLVPARIVNEVIYCERLAYLEWAQGEFADNAFTVEGRVVHTRADTPGGALPAPGETGAVTAGTKEEDDDEAPPPPATTRPYEARAIWLSSERLGITAKIDIVEGDATGRVVPIEYKRGVAPDVDGGAYLPERAQLCAQVLLLREHGYRCDEASIYFAGSKRRVSIRIDDALERITLAAVARVRELAARGELPPPLDASPKCDGCSLAGICLPDETTLLKRLAGEELVPADLPPTCSDLEGPLDPDPWGLAGPLPTHDVEARVRRLSPARDDRLPLYVQEQGARVNLDGERLLVRGKETAVDARLSNTSQVSLYGNVQVSTQALRALLDRGIPLSFFSYGGWFLGRTVGHEPKNIELRIAQHAAAADDARCLALARGFVSAKIRNSRTMLRRNARGADGVVLRELEQLARKAEQASALASLLGIEGTAARVYFGAFTGMLKGDAALGTFDLDGRNRRPPRDPINALLSFVYALLTKDLAVTLSAVGLDPMLGFYHQPRFGRPALALDLMEELRPIVADSVIVGALNNGTFDAGDFVVLPTSAALKPHARKKLLLAYERRMDQLVTHPIFGYRVSYRRVLEIQARLLARVILGELDAYPAFRTR